MDLTIIIVNWNGGDLLLRCLRSIRASRTTFAINVIVVDNDSSDGSRERAQREFSEMRIFNSGANLGFGRANNLVRSLVTTPLVLFLNPDTELRPETLQRSVECFRDHCDVGALGCKMYSPSGELQQQGLQWLPTPWTVFLEMLLTRKMRHRLRRWLPVIDPRKSAYVKKLYGGFLLARKEVLDRAGWFDERYFMYAEDSDLSRTIAALGWKLYYTAEADIIHEAGGSSAKAPSDFSILMRQESVNQLIRKYQGAGGAILHRVATIAGAAIRLAILIPISVVSKGHSGSRFEQKLMILWALGLRRPVVAQSDQRVAGRPVIGVGQLESSH